MWSSREAWTKTGVFTLDRSSVTPAEVNSPFDRALSR